jgi:Rieske Fe-S protein
MSTEVNPEVPQPEAGKPEGSNEHLRPEEVSRRMFLFKVSVFLNGIVGAIFAIPIIGYLLGPAMKRGKEAEFWVDLGSVDQFPLGQTRLATFKNPSTSPWDGQTADLPCWVRRVSANNFQVFAINCAHLGCPVRWFPQSRLFMCPCHGGVYYEDGSRASGPPERGLFQYAYKIESNNLIISVGDLPNLADPGTKHVAECRKPSLMVAENAPLVQIGAPVRSRGNRNGEGQNG